WRAPFMAAGGVDCTTRSSTTSTGPAISRMAVTTLFATREPSRGTSTRLRMDHFSFPGHRESGKYGRRRAAGGHEQDGYLRSIRHKLSDRSRNQATGAVSAV